MTGYIALAQLALYATGAVTLYRVVLRFVAQRRMSAFAASACYWVVLALAPSIIALAVGRVGNYIYANGIVVSPSAWDVGLAMWLFAGVWACYLVGLVAASFATWQFVQVARGGARAHAT